jgi:hypothetical protein
LIPVESLRWAKLVGSVGAMADQLVRRVNLLAMLEEDEPDVPVPPECAAEDWTEDEIRAYYASGGSDVPAPKPKAALPTTMQAMVAKERGTTARAGGSRHGCIRTRQGMRRTGRADARQLASG